MRARKIPNITASRLDISLSAISAPWGTECFLLRVDRRRYPCPLPRYPLSRWSRWSGSSVMINVTKQPLQVPIKLGIWSSHQPPLPLLRLELSRPPESPSALPQDIISHLSPSIAVAVRAWRRNGWLQPASCPSYALCTLTPHSCLIDTLMSNERTRHCWSFYLCHVVKLHYCYTQHCYMLLALHPHTLTQAKTTEPGDIEPSGVSLSPLCCICYG